MFDIVEKLATFKQMVDGMEKHLQPFIDGEKGDYSYKDSVLFVSGLMQICFHKELKDDVSGNHQPLEYYLEVLGEATEIYLNGIDYERETREHRKLLSINAYAEILKMQRGLNNIPNVKDNPIFIPTKGIDQNKSKNSLHFDLRCTSTYIH